MSESKIDNAIREIDERRERIRAVLGEPLSVPPADDEATTAAHLTDLAAFVRQQRAQGWREAIEALRDDDRFEAWACDLPAEEYARYDKAVFVSFDAILAYLESLAPKETP